MNRFVKDNLTLFIIMGSTVLVALILLTFAFLGHARMYSYYSEAEQLRSQIEQLIKQKPAPVQGNEAPIREEIKFYKDEVAQLLPHFGQIKEGALNAFIYTLLLKPVDLKAGRPTLVDGEWKQAKPKNLEEAKQKFLETFRAAWNADEDRKMRGGRQRFYRNFVRGRTQDHNWAANMNLTELQREERWELAQEAFRNEYQKLTVEKVDDNNEDDILMSVFGVPRNFDGKSDDCMRFFMVPMLARVQEICAAPPISKAEQAKTDAKAKPAAAEKTKKDAKAEKAKKADVPEDMDVPDVPDEDAEETEEEEKTEKENAPNKLELLNDALFFGFKNFYDKREAAMPPDQIADVVKNWEVIGNLVLRIATEGLSSLNSFHIRNLAGEKHGRYVIYHYTFSVTGEIAKIRALVKNLNDAAKENRMFIIRSIFLYADHDGAQEIFMERQQEIQQKRQALEAGKEAAPEAAPENVEGRRRRGRSAAAAVPGPQQEAPAAATVKTPEQLKAEEQKKPYDKRAGYGRTLFGGSQNCEAVFDVEYVYLAEQELN